MSHIGSQHRYSIRLATAAATRRLRAGLAVLLTSAVHLDAQPQRVECIKLQCEMQLTEVATLERRGPETEIPHVGASVVLDSKGRVFVGPVGGYSSLAVYDPSGAFIRKLGRNGAGPGEFRHISQVFVSPTDTLYVMDISLRRLSVFDPNLRFVRTIPMFPNIRMVASSSGALFGVGNVRSSRAVGYAVHEYSPATGERIRSSIEEPTLFGSTEGTASQSATLSSYLLAVASTGAPLVSRPAPLRFHFLIGDQDEVRYQPTWLPHPAPRYRTRPGRAATGEIPRGQDILLEPMSIVYSIALNARQQVLLVGSIPAHDWRGKKSPYDLIKDGQPGTGFDWAERSRLLDGWYDTVFELIDLPSGRRIASTRSSGIEYRALSTTKLARLLETEDGTFDIQLLRVDTFGVSRP